MNRSTIGRRYGLIPSLPSPHYLKFPYLATGAALPAVCNELEQYLPPVIDQMQVGMCTGCGTSRALKTLLNSIDYKWNFTPSALDIYAKVRTFEGQPLTNDSGASIADVMTVLSEQGVCPEDSSKVWSWPFSASDGRWQEQPPEECETDALKHKLVQFRKIDQNVDSIKTVLASGYPVVIGISVYQSFESKAVAETGVIPMPGLPFLDPLLGGHCLFLWGYGNYDADHADGRNSWSDKWGDKGNFHIPFAYLTDPNLTSDLWSVEVVS